MLVCRTCGHQVRVAGQPCGSCGSRAAIDARFYDGEVTPLPAAADPSGAARQASAAGTLPDDQRAWSPWLAGAVSLVFGPAGGALVASRNLIRLRHRGAAPWAVALAVLAGQLLVGVLAGLVARSQPALAWSLSGLYAVAVAAVLIRWQWGAVARQRREIPGRHTPGTDAFGVFLMALAVGLVGFLASARVADAVSHGSYLTPVRTLIPKPKPPAPALSPYGMPPM